MQKVSETDTLPFRVLERLPDAVKRLASDKGSVQSFESGEMILGPSQWGDEILFVLSGEAQVVLRGDGIDRVLVDILGPGDIFGEVSFFTGSPWPSDSMLIAEGRCAVLRLPPADFEDIVRSNSDFAVSLVKNLVRKIIRLDRDVFHSKERRRSLQTMLRSEEQIFADYYMGEFVREQLDARVRELGDSDGPVLIMGEAGVGKEGLAHNIFKRGYHGKEVFIVLDLLKIDGDQGPAKNAGRPLTDEREITDRQLRLLFGSEEAGRDGGVVHTPGYFELAHGGTLMIRGIEQLSRVCQLKVLEALATESYRREGGSRLKKGKVRLLATTRLYPGHITIDRHPLLVALLQRCLVIPPLRNRKKEIPSLVQHYLQRYGGELKRGTIELPLATMDTLIEHQWPGNDQELAMTLKRAMLVTADGVLRPTDIYFDLKKVPEKGKFNLLSFKTIRQTLESPLYPAVVQSAAIPFFFIVLGVLFLGPSDPMRNPAALVAWALGWPIMILTAFFFARFWCAICPIGTVGNLAKRVLALEIPFPLILKKHNDFLIAGTVLLVIWVETATDVRNSPVNLGLLLTVMLISAIVAAAVFERQSWCLYLCGLGGMVGLLAKTSMVEMRADRNVCVNECSSNDCYVGKDRVPGCPFGHAGPRLQTNRLCKLCGNCVKNCPHTGIKLNLRLPGREIWEFRQPKSGIAFLVLGMFGGLFCEMISKVPLYHQMTEHLPIPPVARFTVVFVLVLVIINLMLLLAAWLSRQFGEESFSQNYTRYGLALLPLTLGTYLAFHFYYFTSLTVQLINMLINNLDLGFLRILVVEVPNHVVYWVQRFIIVAGLVGSLTIMYRIARDGHARTSSAIMATIPHAAFALMLTAALFEAFRSFFPH
jgi:DNA-binding NtrC family response regulator/polyferredoxin